MIIIARLCQANCVRYRSSFVTTSEIRDMNEETEFFICVSVFVCGPGSVVGIVTCYGLYGPGIESR